MEIIKIDNIAAGNWHRDCELISLVYQLPDFQFEFKKDSDSKKWKVLFENPVAYKVTSEEFIGVGVLAKLPDDGSFFEVKDSEWVNEITDGDQSLKLKHFIFCFYEEIVEVLAEDLNFEDLF
ncbi:hypothetical protein GOV13_01375 [Candidatus Pacearchaeota archaeon]|nr:hypothetical protein [Candidatus Pacearchaeota archaeon]